MCSAIDIETTHLQIVRYGEIVPGTDHTRRGHFQPSFNIRQDTRVLPMRLIPQELLARRLSGYLPANVAARCYLRYREIGFAPVPIALTAWPTTNWKGSSHSKNPLFSGLRVRFRATPFTSLHSRIFLSGFRLQSLYY